MHGPRIRLRGRRRSRPPAFLCVIAAAAAATASTALAQGTASTALPQGPAGEEYGADAVGAPLDCPADLELLLERPYAARLGLGPGDEVGVRRSPEGEECPATVAGVFEPPPDPARLTADRPRVLFHLPDLAPLADRPEEVDRFSVLLAPDAPYRTAAALERLLPGARVLTTAEVARETSTTFEVVRRFHGAIGFITLTAGGVFLACIMILKVQERRSSISALRLVGLSRRTLLRWVVAEATAVSVLGGTLGVGLGHAASWVINRYYRAAFDTGLVFSLVTREIVLQAAALAVGLGLGAGLVAGLRLFALDALDEVGR